MVEELAVAVVKADEAEPEVAAVKEAVEEQVDVEVMVVAVAMLHVAQVLKTTNKLSIFTL